MSKRYIHLFDFGTKQISGLCVDLSQAKPEPLGYAKADSHGVKRGGIHNFEHVGQVMAQLTTKLHEQSSLQLKQVMVACGGEHVKAINSYGVVAIRHKEVTEHDVNAVMAVAEAVPLPPEYQILHVLPQEFYVDGKSGIDDPVGMMGVRLEVKAHIIMIPKAMDAALHQVFMKLGIRQLQLVYAPIVLPQSVLTTDEREIGTCVVDIGAGLTKLSVIKNHQIINTAVLPVAGDLVTSDISVAEKMPLHLAEEIKKNEGCIEDASIQAGEQISIKTQDSSQERLLSKRFLAEVVTARYSEIMRFVAQFVARYPKLLNGGVVFSGGGSNIAGLESWAKEQLQVPVRLAEIFDGTNDLFFEVMADENFTLLGLLYYLSEREIADIGDKIQPGGFHRIWKQLKRWVEINF